MTSSCTVQIWDLAAGTCVQTIDGAHENVIMGLVNWQVRLPMQLPMQMRSLVTFAASPCLLLALVRGGCAAQQTNRAEAR